MIVTVNVTKRDITRSRKITKNLTTFPASKNCPVYFALKRLGFKDHSVSWAVLSLGAKHPGLIPQATVEFPSPVASWIWDFDEGEDVKPFQFQITLTQKQAILAGLVKAPKKAVKKAPARKKKAA